MGRIQINQLKKALLSDFLPFIDDSDILTNNQQERNARLLSRALGAFVISKRYGMSVREAAATIIDGEGDNGVDAIVFIQEPDPTLVILQSKWSENGKGAVDQESLLKLQRGIGLVAGAQWSAFNQRVQSRNEEL